MPAPKLPGRRNYSLSFLPFTALPACLLGVYVMYYSGVSKVYWLTNFIAVGLGILLTISIQNKQKRLTSSQLTIAIGLSVVLLLLTLFGKGMYDVHRWIFVGGRNLNVGLIICPVLMILIFELDGFLKPFFWAVLITLILLIQPDASQVSAFSISATILLWSRGKSLLVRFFLLILTLTANLYTWGHLDNLEPVDYVERIVYLAGRISIYWQYAAFISLALLIAPFFILNAVETNLLSISMGLYFSIAILSAFIGNFPVIIMGYGISPIVGYFIGLNWLLRKNRGEHSTL